MSGMAQDQQHGRHNVWPSRGASLPVCVPGPLDKPLYRYSVVPVISQFTHHAADVKSLHSLERWRLWHSSKHTDSYRLLRSINSSLNTLHLTSLTYAWYLCTPLCRSRWPECYISVYRRGSTVPLLVNMAFSCCMIHEMICGFVPSRPSEKSGINKQHQHVEHIKKKLPCCNCPKTNNDQFHQYPP